MYTKPVQTVVPIVFASYVGTGHMYERKNPWKKRRKIDLTGWMPVLRAYSYIIYKCSFLYQNNWTVTVLCQQTETQSQNFCTHTDTHTWVALGSCGPCTHLIWFQKNTGIVCASISWDSACMIPRPKHVNTSGLPPICRCRCNTNKGTDNAQQQQK